MLVLYIAVNVPVACTLTTPLTWPLLRAARGPRSLGFLGLRDGHWKVIHELEYGKTSLYDLKADSDELRDVAAVYPARAEAYREHLMRWAAAQKYRLTKAR
jgi:hypothetical protein